MDHCLIRGFEHSTTIINILDTFEQEECLFNYQIRLKLGYRHWTALCENVCHISIDSEILFVRS